MSSFTPEYIRNCKSCGHELQAGALACEQCHALVHSAQLDAISKEAKALEAEGKLMEARNHWLMALPLLPRHSKQADWIEEKARALNLQAAQQPAPDDNKWAKRLGPVGVLGALLLKSKGLLFALFKLKFLLSFFSFIAIYWALYGPVFGVGFAVMILIHEMGHYVDIKRRGLPAEAPVFLPGFGAYVKWNALHVPEDVRAEISLAGPFAGWLAAAGCAVYWMQTGNTAFGALARTGAWLNLLNLIPVWMLDGGQATNALSRAERVVLLVASAGLGLVSGEGMLYLVALGFGWRLFTKDVPERPSFSTTAYYLAVLGLLTGLLWLVPHQSVGAR